MTTELTPAMRRSILIAALRDPKLWPPGFIFCWCLPRQCGMGLLHQLIGSSEQYPYAKTVAKLLGISLRETYDIFISYYDGLVPTRQQIADRLEALHKGMSQQ